MPNRGQIADALNSSVNHWQRMINWARTQPATDYACRATMMEQQEEDWTADYCALCGIFDMHCSGCPLKPSCEDEDSLWRAVVDAEYYSEEAGEDPTVQTWAHWIPRAESMLNELKRLQKEYSNAVQD